MKEYTKRNIVLARNLRKNMTPQERKLWYEFLRDYALRFQRQKAIGDYIADFYCAKAELAIELDGSGHYSDTAVEEDKHRTEQLQNLGVTVIRIPNTEVDRNFINLCEYLDYKIRQRMIELNRAFPQDENL